VGTDLNGFLERLIGDLDKLLRLGRHLANKEGVVHVTVIALVVDRDVDIADVSLLQRSAIRNAMADRLVDRPVGTSHAHME
jgi:hypothetical protein